MKLTVSNFAEVFPKVKAQIPQAVIDSYPKIGEDLKFYSDPEMKETIDMWLAAANKYIKDEPKKSETKKSETKKSETKKSEPKKSETKKSETKKSEDKKSEDKKDDEVVAVEPTTETKQDVLSETKSKDTADISIVPYGNAILVYGEGCKAIKEKLKEIGGSYQTLRRSDKPANLKKGWIFKALQKSLVEKAIGSRISEGEVKILKLGTKKYKIKKRGFVKLSIKTAVKRKFVKTIDELSKKDGAKKDATSTKKETKAKKPRFAQAPNWYKTLSAFIDSAGKSKKRYTVRKQVLDIQDRFDEKRHLNTPFIELIREIQKSLLPYANSKTQDVKLPEWKSLVDKCKIALKTVTISKKLAKDDLNEAGLAGCRSK